MSPSLSEGRVYLVDDEAPVRRALSRLLKSAGYECLAFRSAEDFLVAADPSHAGPACLVLDLRMPGLSGLDLQDMLAEWGLAVPVIFMSGLGDLRSGVRAMKSGAVDFLEKPFSEDALFGAITRALERDRAHATRHAERVTIRQRLALLTPREREVFGLIVTGLLNKQVGARLGTTEKTVKVHRARVMQKMGARSLAELVRMAERI